MDPSNSDLRINLLRRAYDVLPGASLGSFYLPEKLDFVVAGGRGAYVKDFAGQEYLDYVLGSGPMILGHAHPAVVSAVKKQIESGTSYYALNEPSILLAEKIVAAVRCAEMVKFCSSGSEATFYALRLARAATGRDKIMKFEGAYHGHNDYAMLSTTPAKPPPFPEAVPDSAGIPAAIRELVLVAPFNDLDTTIRIIEQNAKDLAAVIVEPECRLIAPRHGFLQGLRDVTRRLGIVLVFDEVVTGFRIAYGGAQEVYDVKPDLACYGKIVGGGFPLAAVAGGREIMELSNPRRSKGPDGVYISGTLSGNPMAAAAGLATLVELEKPGAYERLNRSGERLRSGLRAASKQRGIRAQVLGTGPMANIYFSAEPIHDYRSAQKENKLIKQKLRDELLKRHIMTHLAAKLYISLVHTDEDIDRTVDAVRDALQAIG